MRRFHGLNILKIHVHQFTYSWQIYPLGISPLRHLTALLRRWTASNCQATRMDVASGIRLEAAAPSGPPGDAAAGVKEESSKSEVKIREKDPSPEELACRLLDKLLGEEEDEVGQEFQIQFRPLLAFTYTMIMWVCLTEWVYRGRRCGCHWWRPDFRRGWVHVSSISMKWRVSKEYDAPSRFPFFHSGTSGDSHGQNLIVLFLVAPGMSPFYPGWVRRSSNFKTIRYAERKGSANGAVPQVAH